MIYETITLDWDYYMAGMLEKHSVEVLGLMKSLFKEIKIYETQKGLNIIGYLNAKGVQFESLMISRLFLFDDLFRLRNEISKFYDNQEHRINRIWLEKDGIKKKELNIKLENLDLTKFNELIELVKSKRGVKNDK